MDKLYEIKAHCMFTNPTVNEFMQCVDPTIEVIVDHQVMIITTTTKPTKKLLKKYEEKLKKMENIYDVTCYY